MKKTTLAILFTILITLSCIFYSCNLNEGIPKDSDTLDTQDDSYTAKIRDLEDQIIELQQNHYISEAERESEINRLEALIGELKQNGASNNETEKSDNTSTESNDETKEISKFTYSVNDGAATITGYEGDATVLAIPSSIDGYEVTTIADDAFSSASITEVIIPNTVTKIGWFAFTKCNALKSVTVPDSVTSIGYSAFPQRVDNFSIICSDNSFAASYADSYGISYTAI